MDILCKSGGRNSTPDFLASANVVQMTPDVPLSSTSSCSGEHARGEPRQPRPESPAASESSIVCAPMGGSLSTGGRPTLSSSTSSSVVGGNVMNASATTANGASGGVSSPQPAASHGADRFMEITRRRRGQTMMTRSSSRAFGSTDGQLPTFVQDRPVDHQFVMRLPSMPGSQLRHQGVLSNSITGSHVMSPTPRGGQPPPYMMFHAGSSSGPSVQQQLPLSPPHHLLGAGTFYGQKPSPPSAVFMARDDVRNEDRDRVPAPGQHGAQQISNSTVQGDERVSARPPPPVAEDASSVRMFDCTASTNIRLATDRWPFLLLVFAFLLLSVSAQRLSTFSSQVGIAHHVLLQRPKIDASASVIIAMATFLEYESASIKRALSLLSAPDGDPTLVAAEPAFVGVSVEVRKQIIRRRMEKAKSLEAAITRANMLVVHASPRCREGHHHWRCQELAASTLREFKDVGLERFTMGQHANHNSSMSPWAFKQEVVVAPVEGEPWGSNGAAFVAAEGPSLHRQRKPQPRQPFIPWSLQRLLSSVLLIFLVVYVLRKGGS